MKVQCSALIVMALVGAHAIPQYANSIPTQQVESLSNTEAAPGYFDKIKTALRRPIDSISSRFSSGQTVEYPASGLPKQCYVLYNAKNEGLSAKGRAFGLQANRIMNKFTSGSQATADPTATGATPEQFDIQALSDLKNSFEQVNEGDSDKLLTKNPVPSDGFQLTTYALLPTETGAFAIKVTAESQISFFNYYSAGAKAEKVRYMSLDSTNSDTTEHVRIMETCFGDALPAENTDTALSTDSYVPSFVETAPSDMRANSMDNIY
ncbi:hypothetical protein H4R33_007149 [Dimargaris cristalligena]|uniref:Uncharacterized protein n=1 Tax=Dimargaris cristalligena TaxID=215637 RepID=A0A4P9ZMV8_9FUNG|nr:hypothetical protein H4R33_007149 [Dimargaris cristalligena]RKP33640.1 hypothetical protein BJ085DRAFT_39921 [Dimargaris cristalligena]|eukprot:RKP33640.1 hypothetical protein BJ085DRAFT_39921 [Dimargaris cristalligena]